MRSVLLIGRGDKKSRCVTTVVPLRLHVSHKNTLEFLPRFARARMSVFVNVSMRQQLSLPYYHLLDAVITHGTFVTAPPLSTASDP